MDYDYQSGDDGWGGYPDVRDFLGPNRDATPGSMGAVYSNGYGQMRGIGELPPCTQRTPPAEVIHYGEKLSTLGYQVPLDGNACSADYRAGILEFQKGNPPLVQDGLIGPNTKQRIDFEYQQHAGLNPNDLPPPPIPHLELPPGPGPNGGAGQPVSTRGKDNTLLYVGLGVGALALGGLGLWAISR
jgi:hypothetical protein